MNHTKAIVTITDTPDGVKVGLEYDPPLAEDAAATPAQALGSVLVSEVLPELLKLPEAKDAE